MARKAGREDEEVARGLRGLRGEDEEEDSGGLPPSLVR